MPFRRRGWRSIRASRQRSWFAAVWRSSGGRGSGRGGIGVGGREGNIDGFFADARRGSLVLLLSLLRLILLPSTRVVGVVVAGAPFIHIFVFRVRTRVILRIVPRR